MTGVDILPVSQGRRAKGGIRVSTGWTKGENGGGTDLQEGFQVSRVFGNN